MTTTSEQAPDSRQHAWDLSPAQARAHQAELACRVERRTRLGAVRTVAGVDVGFEEHGRITRAAVAVLSWPALQPLTEQVVRRPTTFPYVPGLLSFRELPAVLGAFDELELRPDLVLYDGQGIAHPRRMGIAAHLGVILDLPSIGAAKSRLCGTHEEPGPHKGDRASLWDGDEEIGAVVRTRSGVKPMYISTGHRVDLAKAVAWTLACTSRYRLPETTRRAHRLASEC